MINKSISRLALSAALVAICAPAYATEADEAASTEETSRSDIVVTARKKEEKLQDIPLSITAFTEEAITEAGITDLSDISLQTPGFQFNSQGGQEPGRYNTQLRFRGMNTSQFSPSFATGALFVDGVYVLNGGTSVSLLDIERVEVIKGPQSAQFGRNTFGGAVNFVTRNPSLDQAQGQFEVLASSRRRIDIKALYELPIIPGILSASIGGQFYDRKGEFVATDGGRLGNEQTKSASGVLYFEPSSNFSAKFRAFYSEDRDGAPAGGFIDGALNDSCSGKTITAPDGQSVTPRRYICGALPSIGNVTTITGQPLISSNTTINQPVAQGGVNLPSDFALAFYRGQPQPAGVPSISDVGLKRNTLRLSGLINYNTNGWDFDLVLGMNRQRANWIRDSDVTDTFGAFSNDPQRINDESVEFRISTPQDRAIRAQAGVNYYHQDFVTAGDGGSVALYCVVFADTEDFNNCAFPFPNASNFSNSDKTKVLGLFGTLEWDVTDQITLSFEGRYQSDKLTKGGAVSSAGVSASSISETYKRFLPRAIARWEPSPYTTLYASYAIGAIPGDINSAYIRADARERAQYESLFPSIGESTGQEILKAWELGWKQRAFNNRLYFALSGYYYDWSNLKGRVTANINQSCDSVGTGVLGCDPAINPGAAIGTGEMVRDTNGALVPFLRGNNVLVTGDARIYGIELESSLAATDSLTLSANFAWAHARYKDYQFNYVQAIAGFSQQRGNAIPRFPEFSGNASASWQKPISANVEGFLRADAVYFGKAYVDESNLAYAAAYTVVNLRGGIEIDGLRVELFINNLFDEDRYAAASRWSNFSHPLNFGTFTQYQGVNVTPQHKREFGLRFQAKF